MVWRLSDALMQVNHTPAASRHGGAVASTPLDGAGPASRKPMPEPHFAYVVRGLTKIYGEGPLAVTALSGIDLDIAEGEMLVLLGPSGSGKSTLLNIIGGLDVPTSGTIHVNGTELTALDDAALTAYRRERVGFVFQFYNLIPSLTARENVGLITDIARDPLAPDEALALVGLADRAGHFPAQLSGGEQQRVAVARAIAKRPAVLLCDEPTGALDSATGVVVLETIERVNAELGTTTVLITHNVAIAAMAERVVSLANGRIAEIRTNTDRRPAADVRW